jgi:hypothetical protein
LQAFHRECFVFHFDVKFRSQSYAADH